MPCQDVTSRYQPHGCNLYMFSNNFLFCMNNIQELKVLHHKSSHFKEHTVFSKGHQTLVMDGSSLKGFT